MILELGDVVLALPALSAIRSGFPDAKISILAAASTREILEISGVGNEVFPSIGVRCGQIRRLGRWAII